MGAAFENKIYSWRRNSATLEAKRYSEKLDTGLSQGAQLEVYTLHSTLDAIQQR
jgi:hypothetical protein